MFLATLITNRPDVLQVDQWALRDGEPYRASIMATAGVTAAEWYWSEILVVDVEDMPMLNQVFGDREGLVLLVGVGEAEETAMIDWYRLGLSNGSARVDRFDPRSALMAILDRFRRGEGASVAAVLTRA